MIDPEKLFEIIKDDYKIADRAYRKTFGYPMGSKKELLDSYLKNHNIIKHGPNGIDGFINYSNNGMFYSFKTVAIRKDIRGTLYGGRLMYSLFNAMLDKAREEKIEYIDLVLLTLEKTIYSMAKRVGFEDTDFVIDESRILLRKEMV